MKRLALTFTVVPGSEPRVKEILSGYERPELRVDELTRLLRTSVFLGGNRVVRVVDIEGDVPTAMRHLASQPQIQAVEQELNQYLEEPRDLADPNAARRFFTRASLPPIGPAGPDPSAGGDPSAGRDLGAGPDLSAARYAVLCPVRPGQGEAAARLLADRHGSPAADPTLASTVLQRGDVLVWLLEGKDPDQLCERFSRLGADAERAGTGGRALAEVLAATDDLSTRDGFAALLAAHGMEQLTDRRAGTRS